MRLYGLQRFDSATSSADAVLPGQARNYTRPHQVCDNLPLPSWVLDLGKSYAGGSQRPALANIFKALGIGTKENQL